MFVADRLVLPTLSSAEIEGISSGEKQLDTLNKSYIHAHLSYRFTVLESYADAIMLEDRIKRGELGFGQPLLNPARSHRSTE